jgi:very-short-patch-repair endonuclease
VRDRERGDQFVSVSGEAPGKGLLPGTRNKPLIDSELRDFARKLRQHQPDAEKLMWGLLRDRRLGGYKFRRQHPIAPYVLDFYCHEIKLAVELDGGQHNTEGGLRRDQKRSDFLAKLGIRVLRYWDHAVLEDTENVLESIFQGLTSHTQTPSPGPSPGPGEGEGDQDDANNCELLRQLGDLPLELRTAHYVCHVTLADPSGAIRAESRDFCHGRIRFEPAGTSGFGYDPLFEVVEYHRTFGELGPSVKRAISHRSRAMRAILPELRKVVGTLRVP